MQIQSGALLRSTALDKERHRQRSSAKGTREVEENAEAPTLTQVERLGDEVWATLTGGQVVEPFAGS